MVKPWLLLPPKVAHDLSPLALKFLSCFLADKPHRCRSFQWRDLHFNNPLGIAGGVDKNAEQITAWYKLGCGFIEVGTITPQAQGPNPGKIMDRDLQSKALWNKMGFPNKGLKSAAQQIRQFALPHKIPLFANIGKNRDTPLDNSSADYKQCIHELEPVVDAFVINISSPNTKDLRKLLQPQHLKPFLIDVLSARKLARPTFLKLSPDLNNEVLHKILEVSVEANIDGWIFTNTTLHRPLNCHFPSEGGLSGQPLAEQAKFVLKKSIEFLGSARKDRLIISAGGIMNTVDVQERLELGADLIQVYSALIFNGPFFFKNTLKELCTEM
ncbi:MAG: quinone-dependent dihydroorotate dehydrogenase [Bdellovibrionales bacterium]|nr:quinone-dependent dihydroorotate dehydrogenase [Bdellovibrionales bacterium]